MQIKGTQTIDATRSAVWAGLNNPEVLQQCIAGCEKFEELADGQWQALVLVSVGPVTARFKGRVSLDERQPLLGYRLSGEGEGGIAGFGQMEARVSLQDSGTQTRLDYVVDASVGGKLAQIGSRLVSGVAQKMADDFFARFHQILSQPMSLAFSRPDLAAPAKLTDHPNGKDKFCDVSLTVNGQFVQRYVDPRMLLVELLRQELSLTGTHVGCDTSQCGACTVRLDGAAVKSCSILAAQASGGEVVTIEGLAPAGTLHALQKAFKRCHALQCGFCTPGMILAADDLLRSGKQVTDASILQAIEGNLCRCTGYVNIIEAVHQAARDIDNAEAIS
jgi:aerobic-type carbon monoxide dehydrogenase small subunit (CoxS/CutS family)/carbon monoxide dehydrogenase subunit G